MFLEVRRLILKWEAPNGTMPVANFGESLIEVNQEVKGLKNLKGRQVCTLGKISAKSFILCDTSYLPMLKHVSPNFSAKLQERQLALQFWQTFGCPKFFCKLA